MAERSAAQRRRALSLLVVMGAVLAVPVIVVAVLVGLLVGAVVVLLPVGVALGVALAVALLAPAWRHAEARALSLLDVHPADPAAHARLFNLVEGLCTAAGVPRPRLFVIDVPAANAASFGRDGRHGCLVVTTGLLANLGRIELEGVVAHELAHLRGGETAAPTVSLAVCGSLAAGSLAGVATWLVGRAAPEQREAAADLAAVSLTRYPPGLLVALEKIRDGDVPFEGVPRATAPLWLAPVGAPAGRGRLEERIEALHEL